MSKIRVAAFLAATAWATGAEAQEPVCGGYAIAEPNDVWIPRGCYLDIDGQLKRSSDVYDARLDRLDPAHLLTLGELIGFLGAGVIWYAADDERNLADWDFPSWKQRFNGDAWTFDNNHFPINWMGHPLSGAAYYAFPRARDNAVWVSSIYALMTSFVWEFFVEFREKVSVNDLIATYGAGLNIGEWAHKFWRYYSGIPEKSSTLQDFLSVTLGFPIHSRRWTYQNPQHVAGPYDKYGFSNHVAQHLFAAYQLNIHAYGDDERASTHGLRLGGRLSTIPGEGRPGDFAMFFHEADVVEGYVTAAFGTDARQWDIEADTQLLGVYGQRIDTAGNGYAGTIALETGYRYRFWNFDNFNDRLGIFHIPGIGGDFTLHDGSIAFSADWRLNPDFAGIHSAAYPVWRDEADLGEDDLEKTILRKHGYYFAWGLTSRFRGALSMGPFDLRAGASIGVFDSQEGLDRNQADINVDLDLTDRILELDTEVGFTIPESRIRVDVGYGATERRSRAEHIQVDRTIHTWSLGVSASL